MDTSVSDKYLPYAYEHSWGERNPSRCPLGKTGENNENEKYLNQSNSNALDLVSSKTAGLTKCSTNRKRISNQMINVKKVVRGWSRDDTRKFLTLLEMFSYYLTLFSVITESAEYNNRFQILNYIIFCFDEKSGGAMPP